MLPGCAMTAFRSSKIEVSQCVCMSVASIYVCARCVCKSVSEQDDAHSQSAVVLSLDLVSSDLRMSDAAFGVQVL